MAKLATSNNALGVLIALGAGATLASVTSIARYAYDRGTEPFALIGARMLIALVLVVGIEWWRNGDLHMPAVGRRWIVLGGVSLSLIGLCYLSSVQFISPALAVAILYLFPVIVLIVESLQARHWPKPAVALAFAAALAGIVVCVGVNWSVSSPLGIVLALVASCAAAGLVISSSHAYALGAQRNFLAWCNLIAGGVVFLVILLSPYDFAELYGSAIQGSVYVVAAALFYAVGITLSIVALKYTSGTLASLALNIEPPMTMLIAWWLLGDRLSNVQYWGMLLAVIAISWGTWALQNQHKDN
ncbi:MAG: DMT family transporter [Gammaproteobacteria bacterium]|nr:DMT family transporter [Gammaproteobacteria bacterium]